MKSPGFRVKTTISGDFNNHKTKNKVINTDAYSFSGATIYLQMKKKGCLKHSTRGKRRNERSAVIITIGERKGVLSPYTIF
jgi:hypothetical protein